MEDPNAPQIFWLADVAGSGKSTVANHLAEEWKNKNHLAGRFFFSRDAEQTRSPLYFFTTIAQQGLFHLGPAVRTAISDGIHKLCNPTSAPLKEQCTSLFVRPLEKISSTVVLVLDALDECEPTTVPRLLQTLLPQLLNLHHLKLFLTSRPENYITDILKHHSVHQVSLTSNQEKNREDVQQFMGEKLRSISIPEAQIYSLVARSEGLFIWASTVCKILQAFRGNRNRFIADLLFQGPRKMNEVYKVALQQALWSGSSEEANLDVYKRVLSVVVAAFEPLSPKSIDELLEIDNTFDIVKDLHSVLDCSNSETPVRFLHPTFREFLLQQIEGHPCRIDDQRAHVFLAQACLDLMDRSLQWDMCGIFDRPLRASGGWWKTWDTDLESSEGESNSYEGRSESRQCRLHKHISLILQYSCLFWAQHLYSCNSEDITAHNISSRLRQFFYRGLLHWIYVLSFIKSARDPWTLMRDLVSTQVVRYSFNA
jgi:hypothetical protein